jgi:hypothetical protein
MGSTSGVRRLGRFLYTQNPFYLLSCFLVIYGLQIATVSQVDLVSRSVFLAGGIGLYTLLMVLTTIGVIRLGKVWDDGRSILLVVAISLVALSTSLDELCLIDPTTALSIAIAGLLGSIIATESVLRACRIVLPFWYRASYCAMLFVFFATPVGLGRAVAERHESIANWGAVIFSCLFSAAILILIPAVKQGRSSVRSNGTPWRWPLYPLSLFVILIVLAGIRTHAIWMSFGFIGETLGFEPFLLMPMFAALLILAVEHDVHRRRPRWSTAALLAAPVLLLCGLSQNGMTSLPIRQDLQYAAGSATTLALVVLATFYAYAWLRGVRHSEHALVGSLLSVGFFADVPTALVGTGFQPYVFVMLAALFYLILAIAEWHSDVRWFAFASLASVAIAMAGPTLGDPTTGYLASSSFLIASFLTIGCL